MPSAWNPISGAPIEGEGTVYNSSFAQSIGYFSPWAGANYPVFPATSPFYNFSAETGYGGGDTSLSSLSNAGYGGGYFDTGSGLGGGPSIQSLVPGMDAVPDALIFNPDAVPSTPWTSYGGPTASGDLTPVQFRGYAPDIWGEGSSGTEMNPFPEGPPASWARPIGNQFAGGLFGAWNRAEFFGPPLYRNFRLGAQFTGGVFGGETIYLTSGPADLMTPGVNTAPTLGGSSASTYVITQAPGLFGPGPDTLYPPTRLFPPVDMGTRNEFIPYPHNPPFIDISE